MVWINTIAAKFDRTESGWEVLYGHCCCTVDDMHTYVNSFDPSGQSLRVVSVPFPTPIDIGEFVNEPKKDQIE